MNGETPGETIRRARQEARLTQARLAAELGVHKNTVADWEKGKYFPDRHWGALNKILHIGIRSPDAGSGPEPKPRVPDSLRRYIMNEESLTPEERQAVIDAVERQLAIERGEAGGSSAAASSPSSGRRPQASLPGEPSPA